MATKTPTPTAKKAAATDKKLAPGSTVDSWCTKCKLVLAHTVEAMVAGKITRVHCNTCRGQHAYRASAPSAGGSSGKSGKARTSKSRADRPPERSEYETLLRGRSGANARPYATSDRFSPGELIQHSVFGLGVVTAERDSVKIDVVFPAGPKVLLHGR
jgi:hypothetical protein